MLTNQQTDSSTVTAPAAPDVLLETTHISPSKNGSNIKTQPMGNVEIIVNENEKLDFSTKGRLLTNDVTKQKNFLDNAKKRVDLFKPFPNKPLFLRVWSTSLLKTQWE